MKRTIFTLLGFIPILLFSQINLITSGLTSGGGSGKNDISLDFAFGQVLDTPFNTDNVLGSEGVLQNLETISTSTFSLNEEEFQLFPNPTNSILNISMPCNQKYVITLFDNLGKIIKTISNTTCMANVDMSQLSQGLYHVKISRNQKFINFLIAKN